MMNRLDRNRISGAIEVTQFSGIDVESYWKTVMERMLERPELTGKSSIPKEWFLGIVEDLFPKWNEERRKFLATFIMETLHDAHEKDDLDTAFKLFKNLRKVRILKDEKGQHFTELQLKGR